MRRHSFILQGLLAGVCMGGMACDTGGLWPASMEQQPVVHPLAEARPPPVGSIPLGGIEALVDRDDADDLKPPFPLDASAAAAGKRLFAVHCTSCHGLTGRGDGPVSTKFPQAPNLRYDSICKRSDGYLYGTLMAGGRAMPSMREGTTTQDRWQLVAFVRSLQAEGCTGAPPPAGGTP